MSYQVLARKYRPKTFAEVVGQTHVTTTLANAIQRNRVHHAYLFTGVRGTGKTSLARILAKALNCEKGPAPEPCNQCTNCLSIDKGQFLDVHEIDGASNTSVDHVRELREQVKYLPAAGRYKVYIIDEVHMLSTSAFNALLKTLEEPPPHVLFIFATTEVHKIPLTILSRTQRFDLRRLQVGLIRERLEAMCRAEQVTFEPGCLEILARAAEGSMRDAQSLLDMAMGVGADRLKVEDIRRMLGQVEGSWIQGLSLDCLRGDGAAALARVQEIYDRGLDLRQVATQWVEYLHDLALLKAAGPESLGEGYETYPLGPMEEIVSQATLAGLQVAFQTVYRAVEQIFRSDSPKILFDLLVVKLIHGSPFTSLGDLMAGVDSSPPQLTPVPLPRGGEGRKSAPGTAAADVPRPKHPFTAPNKGDAAPLAPQGSLDREALDRALHKHPQIKAILEHALSTHMDGGLLTVSFETGSIWVDMFQDKRETLAKLLSEQIGSKVQVTLHEQEKLTEGEVIPDQDAEAPDDPVVRQAMEILNAKVKEVKKI